MRLRFESCFSHHRAAEIIVLRIFIANMWILMETIELAGMGHKKLRNAAN